jgi:hypothetical protein
MNTTCHVRLVAVLYLPLSVYREEVFSPPSRPSLCVARRDTVLDPKLVNTCSLRFGEIGDVHKIITFSSGLAKRDVGAESDLRY